MKKERMEWIRHLVRMDHGRVARKTFAIKLEERNE